MSNTFIVCAASALAVIGTAGNILLIIIAAADKPLTTRFIMPFILFFILFFHLTAVPFE